MSPVLSLPPARDSNCKRDDVIRAALAFDIGSLNPFEAASAGSLAVLRYVHEPLMRRDLGSGVLSCGLLSRLPRQLGNASYELTLRAGLRFHDGSPLTATDVAASLRTYLNGTTSKARVLGDPLSFIEAAQATNDLCVRVDTKGQAPLLAERLALVHVLPGGRPPVPSATSAKNLGTGPFRMHDIDNPAVARLERFDGYLGDWPGRSRYVELHAVIDPKARAEGLLRGRFHAIEDADPALLEDGGTGGLVEFAAVPGQNMTWLMFNCAKPPFNDVRVRRAVAHAVDRDAIARRVHHGNLLPADSLLAASHPDHVASARSPHYDPRLARALLEGAGAAGSHCDVFVSNASWVAAQLPIIADQLRRVGLVPTCRVGPTTSFFDEDAPRGEFQMAICSGDPTLFGTDGGFLLGWYLSGRWPRSYLHWNDEVLNRVEHELSAAAGAETPSTRREALGAAQRLTAEHCPILAIGHRAQPTAWSKRLRRFTPSMTTGIDVIDAELPRNLTHATHGEEY
jgi:peptide/nickel transport system substrate-binding protein